MLQTQSFARSAAPLFNRGGGASEQREQVWEGKVHKCPNCGETLNIFAEQCPACGHVLRDVNPVVSLKELATKIESAGDDARRVLLVKNYPIPNSREDIIEFLIMAITNIDESSPFASEEEERLSKAWIVKAEQALQKAELVIPNDKLNLRSRMAYEKKVKAFEKALKKRGKRKQEITGLSDKESDNRATVLLAAIIALMLTAMSAFLLL